MVSKTVVLQKVVPSPHLLPKTATPSPHLLPKTVTPSPQLSTFKRLSHPHLTFYLRLSHPHLTFYLRLSHPHLSCLPLKDWHTLTSPIYNYIATSLPYLSIIDFHLFTSPFYLYTATPLPHLPTWTILFIGKYSVLSCRVTATPSKRYFFMFACYLINKVPQSIYLTNLYLTFHVIFLNLIITKYLLFVHNLCKTTQMNIDRLIVV